MAEITFEEIVDRYNKLLDESRRVDYIVRDKDLQQEQVGKLDEFRKYLTSYKQQAVKRSDEKLANVFFHLRCVINAQMSLLQTWISIKEGKAHEAWNHLVDAQEYVAYAIQTGGGHDKLDEFAAKLRDAERFMFPVGGLYNSMGLVYIGGVCSVCERPLEECEHLEGKVYWGRVCNRIMIEKVDIDHFSLVSSPKDRRCAIRELAGDDGFVHDSLTWKALRPVKEGEERHVAGVVLDIGELDIY